MTSRKLCERLKYVLFRLFVNWDKFELIHHRKEHSLKNVGVT